MRASAPALAAGGALTVWLGYIALGVAYFFWYMEVPLACWFLLAAVGFPDVVRSRALAASIALFVIGSWTIVPVLYRGRSGQENDFARVADALGQRAQKGQSILLEPIGLIGYYTGLHVYDEVGLVSPWIAERRLGPPGWEADVLREHAPDWVLVRRAEMQSLTAFAGRGAPFRSAAERDSLLGRYEIATEIGPQDGEGTLVLLGRAR